MKFDFWMELPNCLIELKKDDISEEEWNVLNNLGNCYDVRKFYKSSLIENFDKWTDFLFKLRRNVQNKKQCRRK